MDDISVLNLRLNFLFIERSLSVYITIFIYMHTNDLRIFNRISDITEIKLISTVIPLIN